MDFVTGASNMNVIFFSVMIIAKNIKCNGWIIINTIIHFLLYCARLIWRQMKQIFVLDRLLQILM